MANDPSRRQWLRNLGAATAVAAVPATVGAGVRKVENLAASRAPTEGEKQLARDLVPNGVRLFDKWEVAAAPGLYFGAIPVILRTKTGHEFQVDILRHDVEDPRRPLARSGDLAIYVVNGGDGRRKTSEDEGRGALALGMYLDQRGAKAPPLMTLTQRSKSFGNGGFVLLDDDTGVSSTENIVADRLD
jgi:hypothetical protein